MRIAIISDTHDNLVNIKKCFEWLKQHDIKNVIHCGDVCAPAVIKFIIEDCQFDGRLDLVFGNVDGDEFRITNLAQRYEDKFKIHGELGKIELDNQKIAFCHMPDFAKALAQTGDYNLVFYGHTHKPWEEKINNCLLLNPGTLAGMFYKASFAIYDTQTGQAELKILEQLNF
ncbi:MAG: YfcE family phosphodiesterase [Patescibacteria group bacterium]|nr:YfcE family phosphodiesterase [Patescibacteria group bacterium]